MILKFTGLAPDLVNNSDDYLFCVFNPKHFIVLPRVSAGYKLFLILVWFNVLSVCFFMAVSKTSIVSSRCNTQPCFTTLVKM